MNGEITLPEAAHRAGLTWPAAHKAAMRGDFGPVRQVAGRWLIKLTGFEAFLQRRRQLAKSSEHSGVA
jgi:hypothetical protein